MNLVDWVIKNFFAAEDVDELGRHESSGESEEDLHELAGKEFDSDPEMNIPLKKIKGIRRAKSIVVLERRKRSKKLL